MTALLAFDAAARHRSFSAAASERSTSQPAISRHIADLEAFLATSLFERSPRGVRPTAAGERFRDCIASALDMIETGIRVAEDRVDPPTVVIACSHETSSLLVMPRFEALRQALGEDTSIRVLTCDLEIMDRLDGSEADLAFTFEAMDTAPEDRAVVFDEAVTPVCAPGYAQRHAAILARPVEDWGSLTFLDFSQPNRGWATWNDWFALAGRPRRAPRFISYENYLYLLEAAGMGQGIALGWRHYVDRYIQNGRLVAVHDEYAKFDRPFYAVLSERGRRRPLARRCLEFFARAGQADTDAAPGRDRGILDLERKELPAADEL